MNITYEKKGLILEITDINFVDSGASIECKFYTKIPVPFQAFEEDGMREIAVGKGLNAGEAFISALKDLDDNPEEIYDELEKSDK